MLLRIAASGVVLLGGWTASAQEGASCEGPPELRAAIGDRPSEEAYNALGYWFTEHANLACAVSAFRTAVELNGDSAAARYNLGIALSESGDDQNAATHLKAASRLAPNELNVHQALGAVLLRLEQWDEPWPDSRSVRRQPRRRG